MIQILLHETVPGTSGSLSFWDPEWKISIIPLSHLENLKLHHPTYPKNPPSCAWSGGGRRMYSLACWTWVIFRGCIAGIDSKGYGILPLISPLGHDFICYSNQKLKWHPRFMLLPRLKHLIVTKSATMYLNLPYLSWLPWSLPHSPGHHHFSHNCCNLLTSLPASSFPLILPTAANMLKYIQYVH